MKKRIDSIADCIGKKIQKGLKDDYLGLYSGEFGLLLFLFYYARYTGDKKFSCLAESYAETLLERLVKDINTHTFSGGLSGVLYLFAFLRENNFIDIDVSNMQPEFNLYLVNKMRYDIQVQNYDYMHGALGVGLLFLKSGTNPEQIQELIDFLYNTAEKDSVTGIFKWKFLIDPEKNAWGYNIALSHGMAGIVIFLSRVVTSGYCDSKVMEMLHGAINYILSQQIDFHQFGSFFPNQSLENKPSFIAKSRLAWCYGDLGIAMSLWLAGKAIRNMEWQDKGLACLLSSTQRLSLTDNYVKDAGICHGSAGIAMIYNRMYLETKRTEFKDSVQYWIDRTLDFAHFEDGLAGYKTHYQDGLVCNYSLLMGIAGVGLVLLSYLEDDKQIWDEMLLIS
ncbi:MAG: lanthionine synthetase C family protein [Dysgonamonadaceae bacterium]|nr:lanthionine synthetase C family protein [Dysgonamonadaceae bacterium]